MTTPRITLTTALAVVAMLASAGTALAQKPAEPAAPRVVAPDAAAAARASKVADKTSALGSYYDADSGEQVVVAGRKSRLTEAAVDKAVGAPARLERLTITGATVDAIRDKLVARDFSPAAKKYSYGGYLDLESGKFVLTTNAPAAVTDELTDDHPGTIDLRHDTVRDMFHRLDDVPSYWGGASIMSPGVGTCSNGFTVQRGGQRFMTTASHCFGLGAGVFTPTNRFVGTVVQRGQLGSPFPWDNRDTELIGGSSYAGRVYDGGIFSTTSKGVVGAGDPVPGFTGYCTSGQTSGERCGITVQSTEAIACTATGCKWPVISYTGGPSQPGDSGAPMYLPSGTSAFARGTVIAGDGVTSYAEKWSRMAAGFGISIVTG
jgi:hypothetical protein